MVFTALRPCLDMQAYDWPQLAGVCAQMIQILALTTLLILIFGALFTAGDGVFAALWLELLLICGAAFGILIIGNAPHVAARALSGFGRAVTGSRWKRADYVSLMALLDTLTRRARQGGLIAIEDDIEAPQSSKTFQAAPRILAHEGARELICETFRLVSMDLSDKQHAVSAMRRSIERSYESEMRPVNALHSLGDALPALGIVAAIIGIIRAMGVIDQAPGVVAVMMGAALLGTFLGVFLAYGIVAPVASRLGQIVEEEERFFIVIETVLSAYINDVAPLAAIELGRGEIPTELAVTSASLRHAMQAARFEQRQNKAA